MFLIVDGFFIMIQKNKLQTSSDLMLVQDKNFRPLHVLLSPKKGNLHILKSKYVDRCV